MRQLKIIFIIIFLTGSSVFAAFTKPLLVLDAENVSVLPEHYRTTSDSLPKNNPINWDSLSSLHIMGSAEFSALGLEKVLQRFPTQHITVVDLRQESHGFLNGNAISWYGPGNAANAGKKPEEIEKDQANRLHKLNKLTHAIVYKILSKTPEEAIDKVEPMDFTIRQVISEKALVKRYHLNYTRFYVADFHAPSENEVNRFIQFVKKLPATEWVYFHCRAGVGRTTTFMVMYDMMRNAKRVSFEDIISRQAAIGGKSLAELPAPKRYKYQWAVERLNFLRSFYEYCRDNNDNFQTTWTAWLKLSSRLQVKQGGSISQ